MFKLVVLSALVAIVAAKPSHLAAPLAYSAYSAAIVPAAVSHQSRTDVISKPVIAAYAAPAVAHVAAPVAYAAAAPVAYAAAAPVAVSAAVSHSSRVDVHSAPVAYAAHVPAVAAVHAAPYAVHGAHYAHAAPLVHAW